LLRRFFFKRRDESQAISVVRKTNLAANAQFFPVGDQAFSIEKESAVLCVGSLNGNAHSLSVEMPRDIREMARDAVFPLRRRVR
jgi:hypothetical protein